MHVHMYVYIFEIYLPSTCALKFKIIAQHLWTKSVWASWNTRFIWFFFCMYIYICICICIHTVIPICLQALCKYTVLATAHHPIVSCPPLRSFIGALIRLFDHSVCQPNHQCVCDDWPVCGVLKLFCALRTFEVKLMYVLTELGQRKNEKKNTFIF